MFEKIRKIFQKKLLLKKKIPFWRGNICCNKILRTLFFTKICGILRHIPKKAIFIPDFRTPLEKLCFSVINVGKEYGVYIVIKQKYTHNRRGNSDFHRFNTIYFRLISGKRKYFFFLKRSQSMSKMQFLKKILYFWKFRCQNDSPPTHPGAL